LTPDSRERDKRVAARGCRIRRVRSSAYKTTIDRLGRDTLKADPLGSRLQALALEIGIKRERPVDRQFAHEDETCPVD
jgi:hypothetical protein